MTNSLRPYGHQRAPLPSAQTPAPGVPSPRPPRNPGSPQPGTATTGPGAKPAKQRDAYFDNAKYLAVVFVAMGHAWEPLTDQSRAAEALYMVVYSFHMPAFILISGYFSRSFDMRTDRLRRLVTGVAVPYILFEIAYSLFKKWADDDPSYPISLLDPWYLTWFLVALFVWRMTVPLWKVVRWPVPLALAIAVLASVSPDIGDDLDLQRVLQFLPFFVVGLFMKPEHFQFLRRREVRILSVPVVLGALVFAYWAGPRMNSAWFYHRDSAQELGAPWWAGVVMTLAMFGCSMVLTSCFLAWVPRRRMWFTVLGAGTLYGYLLHGFLAKGSRFWGWYDDYAWLNQPLGEIFLTVAAAAVITVLCTPPVQRAFRFAMEPKMSWAFKRDATELARERAKS
ncbi:acyltransferase family protein [Streptomyces sp. ActVer]|uniref:acyltransferase family protein n=1 Tax=Streptomyces sp. ActVer TaxID=3014558 RepID=UPI0022B3D5F1|nr:acyltransferase family protein [Streptomyces sp. ActVer]MCZ4510790.1 acyltransferase family protein [Streptomyces sp. ActVer]